MPEGEQVNETSAFIFRIGMTANQWVKVAERRAVVPPVLKDSSLYDQPLTVEWPALLPVTHAEEPLYSKVAFSVTVATTVPFSL